MNDNDYAIACTETIELLKNFSDEDRKKIPEKFINFLNTQKKSDYEPKFDFSKPLLELDLNKNTKTLLALIYRSYWCNDEERKELDVILKDNQNTYDQKIKEEYDYKKMFNNPKITINEENINTINNETGQQSIQSLTVIKENIFSKIISNIKNIFTNIFKK